MKLHSIKLKGIGPYGKEIFVDFDKITGELIAIMGENGAGKTTLLEAGYAGVIYRDTPTRGTLKELATGRDSYVESVISNGHRYKIRQLIDAKTEKGEASVVDENGVALTTSGKLPEFDRWAATKFFSPEVFFSTIFTPQANTGFLGMTRSERKKVLLRQLGIEHYEILATKAREHARIVRTGEDPATGKKIPDAISIVGVEAEIAAVSRNLMAVDTAQAELETAQIKATAAEGALARLRDELATAQQSVKTAEDALRDYDLKATARESSQSELETARTSLERLVEKITNNETVLKDSEAIDAAVARSKELPAEIESARSVVTDLTAKHTAALAEEKRQGELIKAAEKSAQEVINSLAAIGKRLEKESAVAEAKKGQKKAKQLLVDAEALLVSAEAEVERLGRLALSSAEDRAKNLLAGHTEIVGLTESKAAPYRARDISSECITANDAALDLAKTLPTQKTAAAKNKQSAQTAVDTAREALQLIETTLGLEFDIKLAQSEQKEAKTKGEELVTVLAEHQDLKTKANAEGAKLKTQLDSADVELKRLQAEQTEADKKAHLAGPLAGAQARLVELKPQIETQEALITKLESDLAVELGERPTVPDIITERNAVTTAEATARTASSTQALAEKALATATEGADQLALLDVSLAELNQELADWLHLEMAFGRDGLQALEIDAAGPELTETINDLLRTCVGSRWTVSVETTRMSSDNKKQLEGCDIMVADNEANRLATGESLSGGQKVIIGEAISLALTMLSCRRSGVTGATLVRDESGAALSPYYAPKYMAMLRRAAEKMGARFLFVSHNPECQELADAQVHINSDGTVTIK